MDSIRTAGKDLKIVYTPLHGTGNILVRRVLKELGFEHVYVVPEQELPDGNFPTVSYPNPEAEEAFTLGLALARKVDADIVLATDPDADRLGVRVKDKCGRNHTLTEICRSFPREYRRNDGTRYCLRRFLINKVTSNMADAIAANYSQADEVLQASSISDADSSL